MTKFAEELNSKLETNLNFIALEEGESLIRTVKSLELCDRVVETLKNHVFQKGFRSRQEELNFFKKIKPEIESKLKYYHYLYEFEKGKPFCGEKLKLKYFEGELVKINKFISSNQEFYTYYKSGSTHFDEIYFVRDKKTIEEPFNETTFCTVHSIKLSCFIAFDKLSIHINNEIKKLEKDSAPASSQPAIQTLYWTDNKVHLVEFLYAIHSTGSFNRGTLDLKELASRFGYCFNIEMGDIYRTFSEIKLRKEQTKFLDTLRENLLKKIDEDLE